MNGLYMPLAWHVQRLRSQRISGIYERNLSCEECSSVAVADEFVYNVYRSGGNLTRFRGFET